MSSSEFARWQEFYSRHPFGPVRDNMHAAMLAQQMWKVAVGRDVDLSNFMLLPRPPEPELTPQERNARIRAALRAVSVRKDK